MEASYVEEMQNFLVDLKGDVKLVVSITLDAYDLRAVRLLSSVAPVGRDVFTYGLEWQIPTEVHHVFTHVDYLATPASRSYHIFGQYSDANALATRWLIFYVDTYPSAPSVITTGAPVPSGF